MKNKKYFQILAIPINLVLLAGCVKITPAPVTVNITPINEDGIYSVVATNERNKDMTKYFSHEYEQINNRRSVLLKSPDIGKDRPQKLVGLALSGGGIRSAAFQLGLLSGLHNKGELKQVDYLSAVSGGSWAAGSYKIHGNGNDKDDDKFFDELDEYVKNPDTNICDGPLIKSSASPVFSKYSSLCRRDAGRILFNDYADTLKEAKLIDIIKDDLGNEFRECWRNMIYVNYLLGIDVPLSDIEKSLITKEPNTSKEPNPAKDKKYSIRPYLIVNATHSEKKASNQSVNFPFQFTADSMGTTADCANTSYCSNSFRGVNFDTPYVGVFVKSDGDNKSTLMLSHALAISGAVAPASILGIPLNLMEWTLKFPFPIGKRAEELPYRKNYLLNDGGHSENLGALSLMERDVDLIVISDAAFDPDEKFGDYLSLKIHARSLLDKQVTLANGEYSDELFWITNRTENALTDKPDNSSTGRNLVFNGQYYSFGKPEFGKAAVLSDDKLYDTDRYLIFNGQYFASPPIVENLNNDVIVRGRHQFGVQEKGCSTSLNKNYKRQLSDPCRASKNCSPVYEGTYSLNSEKNGTILYIKPPKNMKAFLNYLLEYKDKDKYTGKYTGKDYRHIYNYLTMNNLDFPKDKTFAVFYDNQLIHAYYLLGKFVAEAYVAEKISKFKNGN